MSMEQRYRIVHTDRTDSSTADLTESYDFDIQEGIEASMDTFQFRILLGTKPSRTFEVNDEVDIYIGEGASDPTTLVINGIITELKYSISVDGNVVTVGGVNRIERLLFSPRPALYALDFTHTDANAVARVGWDAIITHLIDKANDYKADDDPTTITYDTTSIPVLGNLAMRFDFDWKSIFELLELLATDEWTPDGANYMMELDTANKLHFRSKDADAYKTPVTTIDLDGATVLSASVVYGYSDVINAVLLNCGVDTAGNSVFAQGWDATSMGQFGAKFKYIKWEQIALKYLAQFDSGSEPAVSVQRDAIRDIGRQMVNKILAQQGQPRYKIDADLLGTTTFTRAKVYKVESSEIPALGTTEPLKQLRLTNIIHRFSARAGWTTRLQLAQDEKTIEGAG